MRPPRALPTAHAERNDVTIICETAHQPRRMLFNRPRYRARALIVDGAKRWIGAMVVLDQTS
jgi:hypothetical protein